MSGILGIVGGGLVVIAAMIASDEYSRYAKRTVLQYEGISSLISHIEGRISHYLSSGEGLWRGFENEELERVGLLSALREGKSPYDAFSVCREKLNIGTDIYDKISEFFLGMGRAYKDEAVASLKRFKGRLEEKMISEKNRLEKNVKVVRALLIGGALAFLILII